MFIDFIVDSRIESLDVGIPVLEPEYKVMVVEHDSLAEQYYDYITSNWLLEKKHERLLNPNNLNSSSSTSRFCREGFEVASLCCQ